MRRQQVIPSRQLDLTLLVLTDLDREFRSFFHQRFCLRSKRPRHCQEQISPAVFQLGARNMRESSKRKIVREGRMDNYERIRKLWVTGLFARHECAGIATRKKGGGNSPTMISLNADQEQKGLRTYDALEMICEDGPQCDWHGAPVRA